MDGSGRLRGVSRTGVHHIGISCPKKLQADELRFWEILGYAETGPARRGLRRFVRWLVGDGLAIQIRLHDNPLEEEMTALNKIALLVPDYARTTNNLEAFGFNIEPAQDYFGYKRAHARSPSGHYVEIMEGSPSRRAYGPLEEGEEI